MVNESVFSGNTGGGVEADSGGTLTINSSVISGNGTGIVAVGTIQIANSEIAFNITPGVGRGSVARQQPLQQ